MAGATCKSLKNSSEMDVVWGTGLNGVSGQEKKTGFLYRGKVLKNI
jgi:hypothetical protein